MDSKWVDSWNRRERSELLTANARTVMDIIIIGFLSDLSLVLISSWMSRDLPLVVGNGEDPSLPVRGRGAWQERILAESLEKASSIRVTCAAREHVNLLVNRELKRRRSLIGLQI
jgi:hypothetical protein